jgi:NADH dehydrogenase
VIPRGRDEVFAFFAEPRNLARLTPRSMAFEFQSDDFAMRDGLDLHYRIRPLLGLPVGWHTRIMGFDPPVSFEDVQVSGPYRRWTHRHVFHETEQGTVVEDSIEYELPLGPLGDLAHPWLVRPELERIFTYRARAIERIFAVASPREGAAVVAVAGGTGFVGSAVAMELRRRGERIVVLTHRGDEARGALPDDVELRPADVTGADDLARALVGVDELVISLAFPNAPIAAPRRGLTYEAVDAAGTERLVEAAARAGVRRLVYVSGAGAAPDARESWFRAKWRAEEAVRASGIAWTIIRPSWIFGPGDVSLNRFVRFARHLPLVPLTNRGRQLMTPVFIDDVARLVADALGNPAAVGRVLEVGGPQTLPMADVIRRATRIAGVERPLVPGPTPLLKLMAAPLTLLPTPPLTPGAIDFINQPATANVGPLLQLFPRRLTPLDDALVSYLSPGAGPAAISLA